MVCQDGCHGKVSTMTYYCTDFSTTENWSYGGRTFIHMFLPTSEPLTIGFTDCCWINPFGGNWDVSTTFSLQRRADTGRLNSSPRATTSPVIRFQQGCHHTLPLAVSDPDGDAVRCRWAEGDECDSVCHEWAGAVLDPDTCVFTYDATRQTAGYKAAAIMLEDFPPNSTVPLSTVALQFLVLVYTSKEPCSSRPVFIPPSPLEGSCIAIDVASDISFQLVAVAGTLTFYCLLFILVMFSSLLIF